MGAVCPQLIPGGLLVIGRACGIDRSTVSVFAATPGADLVEVEVDELALAALDHRARHRERRDRR